MMYREVRQEYGSTQHLVRIGGRRVLFSLAEDHGLDSPARYDERASVLAQSDR